MSCVLLNGLCRRGSRSTLSKVERRLSEPNEMGYAGMGLNLSVVKNSLRDSSPEKSGENEGKQWDDCSEWSEEL